MKKPNKQQKKWAVVKQAKKAKTKKAVAKKAAPKKAVAKKAAPKKPAVKKWAPTKSPDVRSNPRRRGPKGGRYQPVNPKRVLEIVKLRDQGYYFREIADMLSEEYPITGQGVFSIYKKWKPWADQHVAVR